MGRSSWERKMNTFVTPPPRGRRKVSTDQRLRAFDFVLDGTSVAEAARSVGIAPVGSTPGVDTLRGWRLQSAVSGPSESGGGSWLS